MNADPEHQYDSEPTTVSGLRRQLEQYRNELEKRLHFEQVVGDIAARFVRIAPGAVDGAIVDSQRQIVEALDIDRCVLWQLTEGDEDLVYTHVWMRPEFGPPPPSVSCRELFPWLFSKVLRNEAVWHRSLGEVSSATDRENLRRFGTVANAVVPMAIENRVVGALSFADLRREHEWPSEVRQRTQLLAAVFAQTLAARRSQAELGKALDELKELRDRLSAEKVHLQQEVEDLKGRSTLVAVSRASRAALAEIEAVAATDATVLLLGETGCGKEIFAETLHALSRRRDRPMVRVNCAAIPLTLLESELFGRERGAYTGALSRQVGRFELAHGTTIFLDEIGELPLEAQAKLLRVLQDGVVERLGGTRPIQVDVRIVAATNRDLEQAVASRAFREDLYYRLNGFPVRVPPLRERREDIPTIVWTFVEEYTRRYNKRVDSVAKESMAALQEYPWPGNVRELRNVIERAVILAKGPRLEVAVPRPAALGGTTGLTLAEAEADHIRETLERTRWRVRGAGGAAERLGMKPTTLESRMAKLGIRRP